MRCAKCGVDNREGRKFCAKCAAPLARLCPQCGASNEPGEDFCGECATALGQSPTAWAKKSNDEPIRVGEPAAPEDLEGERKTVTALFADIKGSTELMQDLDPEEARAIVDPALKLMIEAVTRYDGYVVQSTGDGIFALFGAPVAHEDHPQRALYAALRMQEDLRRHSDHIRAEGGLPIQARIGVNTGEVVVRSITTGDGKAEYTPIGHTTNLASRMQTLAPIGSIAATDAARKLCEGYFTFKGLGPTKVKGLSEPVNVYEVTGVGPLRTRLQRSAGRGFTKFVGREHEMAAMKRAAELARRGRGQIVAAMAEPGVGKSRLYFEFKATSQIGWMVLETFSISHGKASAYLPVLDLLQGYFKIAVDDDLRSRREKVAGKIAILDRGLEDTMPYLFSLLGIVENIDPLAQMDGQLKKRRTLESIKRILLRESLNQPLMVIFEDLHWIDEATQDFLNLLADSLGTAKLLLLVNYRPEYSHKWNSKTYYTQVRLDPLGKESAEKMLTALVGDRIEVRPLKRLIIERTEGNPFFMEEIVQVLIDEGSLVRNREGSRLSKPLDALKIPPTVQGIIAARMDRLPSDAKELLQTLAVTGREFPSSLIHAVVAKSDEELNRLLDDLQFSEFIYEQPATGGIEYTFKHALTQEVAYNSVLVERRRQLHGCIGLALETLYAGSLDDHLASLAHHYGRANKPDKALLYLASAGKQALRRSAFVESQALLQKALTLAQTVPESDERDACEFELATALVQVLMRTKGYGSVDFVDAAERACALAEKRGNLVELISQLSLIRLGAFITGDKSASAALADQISDLAQRDRSQTSLELAHSTQMQERFNRGDLAGAENYFERWGKEAADSRHFPVWLGATMGLASVNAWALGHADSARERIARGIALALDQKDPYELTIGRYFEALIYFLFREARNAEVAAQQALTLSEEHGFALYRNRARTILGSAKARLGRGSEGVSMIHQAIADYLEAGGRGESSLFLIILADAQTWDGALDDALDTIEEAVKADPILVWLPEGLICRAELRIKIGQIGLAETDFRDVIKLAQKMDAKAWELRATISLARLLRKTDRRGEARTMLAEIYNWFTEGFDTADLIDAKALLGDLNG
jgi:class 3 adenylate cyclase/tetratricopeptide (TPR) repeat protein